jgi:5-deoxy-glucuronate isomerase
VTTDRESLYDGRWLRLERIDLTAGGRTTVTTPAADEAILVLQQGAVDWAGRRATRSSVFGERAHAVHLPPGSAVDVVAAQPSELLLATSRFGDIDPGGAPTFVGPDDVTVAQRGRDTWSREVHDIAVDQVPARHLMVGETFNVPGGWSSFPPHKHDGRDGEPELEEAYHYRFDPSDGFGFQAVGDDAHVVRDRDTVGIPSGTHPVCAAPGYRLSYCWVLSGPVRRLEMVEDERYTWLHSG